uniref:Uncharacterized protein n=1 Tax=Opuntia streptacantha TaxID=393608 RepID=A0A7C9DIP3_OPUST
MLFTLIALIHGLDLTLIAPFVALVFSPPPPNHPNHHVLWWPIITTSTTLLKSTSHQHKSRQPMSIIGQLIKKELIVGIYQRALFKVPVISDSMKKYKGIQ